MKYITLTLLSIVALTSCTEWQPKYDETAIVDKAKGAEVYLEPLVAYTTAEMLKKKPQLQPKLEAVASNLGLLNTDKPLTKDELRDLCVKACGGNIDVMLVCDLIITAYEQNKGTAPEISLEKYDSIIRCTLEGISSGIEIHNFNTAK